MSTQNTTSQECVAIIGMAGRFPGAKNIDEFWSNLVNGIDSITHFTDDELEPSRLEHWASGLYRTMSRRAASLRMPQVRRSFLRRNTEGGGTPRPSTSVVS